MPTTASGRRSARDRRPIGWPSSTAGRPRSRRSATTALDADERLDRDLLLGVLGSYRFNEVELAEDAWSAMAWVYLIGQGFFGLIAREFAPLADRLDVDRVAGRGAAGRPRGRDGDAGRDRESSGRPVPRRDGARAVAGLDRSRRRGDRGRRGRRRRRRLGRRRGPAQAARGTLGGGRGARRVRAPPPRGHPGRKRRRRSSRSRPVRREDGPHDAGSRPDPGSDQGPGGAGVRGRPGRDDPDRARDRAGLARRRPHSRRRRRGRSSRPRLGGRRPSASR